MLYCPPNVTFNEIWTKHGISHCFMDTVGPAICGGFLLLFGGIQLLMYRKYATPTDPTQITKSRLYALQMFLLLLVPVLALLRFFLNARIYPDGAIYGYMIFYTSVVCFSYPFCICLIVKERHYQLPSLPTRGHGLILLLFWTLTLINEALAIVNLDHEDWWFHLKNNKDEIEMGMFVTRFLCSLLIFVLGLKAPGIMAPYNPHQRLDDSSSNLTGSVPTGSAFRNGWRKLRTLFPYLWPKKDRMLQCAVVVCIILLVAGRVIKLFLPIYRKLLVDSLTIEPIEFRWDFVLIYVALSFLQGGGTGGMGLFNNLRTFLWIRVQQYTTREIEIDLFRHLHQLSLRWHLQRKTGEVLRIMDRGTDSINNLLNYIVFSITPTILDLIVAVVYFIYAFNWWFGLIVFLTMFLYIASTIAITEWRTQYQRRMNLADNEQRARSVDSLLNFETVKYYGAEGYEVDCYREAIMKYQKEEFLSMLTLNLLNTAQNIILCLGLLSGSLLCVYLVVHHQTLTVGDFVLFSTYLMDLYMPLNWFGTYYRAIQKNFVDMENMFDLLREDEEIVDAPGCAPLLTAGGAIEFSNVTFGYTPDKLVLRNVSFTLPAGKTIAIVGPSGAGKSTIMRLLFRFYDVQTGSISIDGQNIKLVKQQSLRKAIGVVPQDTVLFNNTIYYNIEYAKIGASPDAVYEAARSADIHERILGFPDRYETKVGERGLRLSGGEKQRVAIARTLLKAPIIVLLDEATSALDTHTERNIQAALARVCANRTTIIVAHRLSTIIHADEILVLKEGSIVERGRHEELLQRDEGVYADMWQQQLKNLDAEQNANDSSESIVDEGPSTTTTGTAGRPQAPSTSGSGPAFRSGHGHGGGR
ncbi:ATP-binding cassette sub-family B member 6, mitochondrial isoform X3 [Drosophila hydei]|nr:ATP-binding cassette sub-family B member 6, mitochondrial isoform X3 [Drosophila hydei]XP_030078815.1 ATP-binding cassette sub-family B member 6, mitochondrial isoform X3 [Drosophila hydei]XP_030078816.1 ATP-binding cassette sub-family B member 6, mitochondrial isoform X3 [Drosophila hydei]XP_030078817.1 ATP-binding cassette sub-family B member 6, mitochondrial isoform X3 [Drosophila hydei]